jgi:hypothetical protein
MGVEGEIMSNPIRVTRSQAKRLERNLQGQGKGQRKQPKEAAAMKVVSPEYTVTVHMSPDCKPETQEALAEMLKCLIEQINSGKWRLK